MGSSSQGLSLAEFDQLFLDIFKAQSQAAIDEAAHCTHAVLDLTSKYLDKPAFETLQQFYDLYFSQGGKLEDQKTSVNEEVDDLVAMLQAQMEAGEELKVEDEDEEKKQLRLSLSALQKRLEGLITLDSGMREKILPAVAAMQSEDAIRQRLDHVVHSWSGFASAAAAGTTDFEALARELAAKMSSIEESEIFYREILGEAAPEGVANRSVFIEF